MIGRIPARHGDQDHRQLRQPLRPQGARGDEPQGSRPTRSTRSPFYGNDEFERLSPLRRIPVLIDGDFTISDSSVICAYLDDAYPGYPLFPADPESVPAPAGSRSSRTPGLAISSSGRSSTRKVVRPLVWGEPTDKERVRKAQEEDIPAALDYLEREPRPDLPRRDRSGGHRHRELLRTGLCGLRRGRRALAANGGVRAAHAGASLHRQPAAVRGRPARRAEGAAPGPARRGRSQPKRRWACANRAGA